jgi:hypothetical protein
VTLGRKVDLPGDGLEGGGQRACGAHALTLRGEVTPTPVPGSPR